MQTEEAQKRPYEKGLLDLLVDCDYDEYQNASLEMKVEMCLVCPCLDNCIEYSQEDGDIRDKNSPS